MRRRPIERTRKSRVTKDRPTAAPADTPATGPIDLGMPKVVPGRPARSASRKTAVVLPPRAVTAVSDLSKFERFGDPQVGDLVAVGLDFGMRLGYAYSIGRPDGTWEMNPWFLGLCDLYPGRFDTGNLCFIRLERLLDLLNPGFIAYEDVKYTPEEKVTRYSAARVVARAATASELLGAFKHTAVSWARRHGAIATGYPIGTLKKRMTGRGNAGKPDMVRACNAEFGTDFDPDTCETTGADDIADAAAALRCGLEEYGPTLADRIRDGSFRSVR
jgi:Holliday junction resolvasome RuvABC endonuclease subunit